MALSWARCGIPERAGVQAMLFDNRVRDLIVPRLLGIISGRTTYVSTISTARSCWAARRPPTCASARNGDCRRAINTSMRVTALASGSKSPRHTFGAALDWVQGAWRANLRADSTAGQVIATAVPANCHRRHPARPTSAPALRARPGNGLGRLPQVSNLTNINPAERSALFTWGETPRTFRISTRAGSRAHHHHGVSPMLSAQSIKPSVGNSR